MRCCRGHGQPVRRGAVLYPACQTRGGFHGKRRGGMSGQRRPGGCHGGCGKEPVQPSEGLRRRGDEAGVPYRPYRRRGRIQALLHFLGRLEPRRRGDGGQSGAEAGRTVASDGELRRFVQPGQARPERPDDVAFGTDGAGGLCPGACVLHRRLPGFYPAASGDSGTSHSGVPRRDGEPELRPGGFPPSGL